MVISMARILRCFVCLLLIGCILVNCSPIRAKAVTVEGTMINAVADVILDSILEGIGIYPGSDSSVLDGVISSCRDAISSTYPVVDGMMNVFKYYRSGTDPLFGIPIAMIEAVRNHLWESSVLLSKDSFFDPYSLTSLSVSSISQAKSYAMRCQVAFTGYRGGKFYVVGCNSSDYIIFSDSRAIIHGYGMNHFAYSDGDGKFYAYASSSTTYVYTNVTVLTHRPDIFTDLDLKLDSVAAREEQFQTGYADWYADAVTVPGSVSGSDEDEEYVPITLPDSAIGSDSDTDIGTGSGTGTGSGSDVGTGSDTGTSTGTIADVITHIKSLGVSFADSIAEVVAAVKAIPAAIADIFTPSAEIGHFALDLKDFFPFCIPFDLYDFFVCLNADPVAPVIDWEIYLPGGDTYPLKLDLAVFDDVAQLLRTLQLLLFCVGLAAKTRDLIKG